MTISRNGLIAVVVLAAVVVVGAFVAFPRYTLVAAGSGSAFRLDRWTGRVAVVSLRREADTRVMSGTVREAVDADDFDAALAEVRSEAAAAGR